MVLNILSTVSLVIELVVLILLLSAYGLKKKSQYREHGLVMLSAVVLHWVTILGVMVPSFAAYVGVPSPVNVYDATTALTFVHVAAGLIAALLGVYLVTSWHLQKNLQSCFKRKRVMDAAIALWILSIVLGIYIYVVIISAN